MQDCKRFDNKIGGSKRATSRSPFYFVIQHTPSLPRTFEHAQSGAILLPVSTESIAGSITFVALFGTFKRDNASGHSLIRPVGHDSPRRENL